ncbi:hypothetical protein Golob_022323 [Gossypium lobatum]|uniref:Uncharacterized protein n=1 Tax=Gossypium lobatum TaxID=34289 RepID=A0A7J8LGC9_9ROSI|nr:hypothetical protein [Gossypium lobatum]
MLKSLSLNWAFNSMAWKGLVYTAFILNFVLICQHLLLQPLVSALVLASGFVSQLQGEPNGFREFGERLATKEMFSILVSLVGLKSMPLYGISGLQPLHILSICLCLTFQLGCVDENLGNAAELFERVSQSIKVKRYSEALNDLNAAIEADPALSEAYMRRASLLRQLCRYEESEKSYKKFLELKPRNSVAEKELSQLHQAQSALETAFGLFESKDYTKALDYVDKVVLVFSPACSKAKMLKLKLLLAAKDYSSVISESGFILKEDENNLEALLLRGHAYYYLADHDVAQRHYQKGLRLDPEHGELKKAYFRLKNLLKKTKSAEDNANKGKLRVAVEDYKGALALDPNHLAHNVHLHLGLCKVLVRLGRGKDALSSCSEALNIDKDLLEALVQRGEAKLLTEDWEGAVEDLKSAAEKSPQSFRFAHFEDLLNSTEVHFHGFLLFVRIVAK